MRNLLFAILGLFSVVTLAQSKGTISGKVQDKDMGLEPLPFVSIYDNNNNTVGTTSDFDGNYSIQLSPGVHTLVFEFVGYETVKKQFTVKAGATQKATIVMASAADALDAVVLTAVIEKNTEEAVLQVQKEAAVTIDAISAETIKKSGASNVAAAVKTVSGVSVQGGKYVYVRGLGDRYTKSLLNGMDIAGLDPDRNTIQLDIFPANILDNVAVVKTASAEYPADFTGGVVDIITKEIPKGHSQSFSIGASYNNKMHFNSNYIKPEGSSTDFLGFDDGFRAFPISRFNDGEYVGQDAKIIDLTNQFSKELAASRATSLADISLGYSISDLHKVGDNGDKFGYQVGISYKNKSKLYEDAIDNILSNNTTDLSDYELQTKTRATSDIASNEVIFSGMGGLTYKSNLSTYKLNLLHIQNAESTAGLFDVERAENVGDTTEDEIKSTILYTERSVTNILLAGSHSFDDGAWDLKWKVSPTFTQVLDKDHRITSARLKDSGEYQFKASEVGLPRRLWRTLNEITFASKVDLVKTYKVFNDEEAKLKFGGVLSTKQRTFDIDDILFDGNGGVVDNGDFNTLLNENVVSESNPEGVAINPLSGFKQSNQYEGRQMVIAAYVGNEMKLFDRLKTILGLRMESYNTFFTGQNAQGDVVYNDENVISKLDLFPSANLIYELNDKFNLRTAFSRTTARPSFKEASITQILDPFNGLRFLGDPELKPTYILNYDVRGEYYGESGFFAALSGFYKSFNDPIEITFHPDANDQLIPQNLGDANVVGFEIELRNNFGFIAEPLQALSFNFNGSFLKSTLQMSEQELERREGAARVGQTVDDERAIQGQSPYLINSGLSYASDEKAYQVGLFYNVQGETLQVVSSGNRPDVYTKPFHSVNLTASKKFGEDDRSKLSLKVSNLLGDKKESTYDSFGTDTVEYFKLRDPGTSVSLGYSLSF